MVLTCGPACTGPLDPCKAVNAWEFGDCFGIVGVSWDGRTCGLQSGCGCDPKTELSCRRLASTLAECEQKTATCPLAPFSWYKQCNTPACTVAFKLPAGVEYCKGAREGSPCTVEGALCASCGLSMVCAKSDPKLQSCPQ